MLSSHQYSLHASQDSVDIYPSSSSSFASNDIIHQYSGDDDGHGSKVENYVHLLSSCGSENDDDSTINDNDAENTFYRETLAQQCHGRGGKKQPLMSEVKKERIYSSLSIPKIRYPYALKRDDSEGTPNYKISSLYPRKVMEEEKQNIKTLVNKRAQSLDSVPEERENCENHVCIQTSRRNNKSSRRRRKKRLSNNAETTSLYRGRTTSRV
mmetsp:Transcript_53843/g.64987  ORF Transcript_53843/g.64987 Transcript_53843/m.64987 type:complete len:211 (+) Transcript_53843:100-732(+)